MEFRIVIAYNRRQYRLKVTRIHLDKSKEVYRVQGRNEFILLQSNRPLFRARGLKYRRPDWKQIEGPEKNKYIIERIVEAIMNKVDSK